MMAAGPLLLVLLLFFLRPPSLPPTTGVVEYQLCYRGRTTTLTSKEGAGENFGGIGSIHACSAPGSISSPVPFGYSISNHSKIINTRKTNLRKFPTKYFLNIRNQGSWLFGGPMTVFFSRFTLPSLSLPPPQPYSCHRRI
jgi:hypothetical protein